jgi:hypothetical protein
VNVLVVKCTKAFISISCQVNCAAEGTGITGLGGVILCWEKEKVEMPVAKKAIMSVL